MERPFKEKIIDFILSFGPSTTSKRESLLIWACLDQKLVNLIDCSSAPIEFVPLLVSKVMEYGKLEDGRDALEAVLGAVRSQVGLEGNTTCDSLIQEWRTLREVSSLVELPVVFRQQNLDYKYDVFLSYGHKSIFSKWVNEIFLERFEGYLREYLTRSVQIRTVEATSEHEIPIYSKVALARSRCLVAICYPTYFKSPQCTYEMSVMLQREHRLGFFAESNPVPLILPVYVFDGERFPEIISRREPRCDCNGLTSTSIKLSDRGVALDDKIIGFAQEVAKSITKAPSWSETFFEDLTPSPSIKESLQVLYELQSLPRW
jgi:hypothetical protein